MDNPNDTNISREYTWTGTFKYYTGKLGYKWSFAKAGKWKILKPRTSSLEDQAKEIKEDLEISLKEQAEKIKQETVWDGLWKNLSQASNAVGIKREEKPLPTSFIDWLAYGKKSSGNVPDGISVMLNHIVATGTIQPFQILSSFVEEHVTVQIKNLHEKKPCWFYLKQPDFLASIVEYVLTCPDLFFKDIEKLTPKTSDELENTINCLRSIRVLNDYSVLNYHYDEVNGSMNIQLCDRVKLIHYKKGRICGCIPVPGKSDSLKNEKENEPDAVLTPEVVVKSPNVSKCLEALSRVWQDHFAKSVLISAPPGSGKEVYATSIPFGNGRQTKNFTSVSLATDNQKSLERLLFGQKREDGTLEKGLVAKAAKSALFLDEVHHPEDKAGIRASFLRILEADEYFPVDSNESERVEDVLFVLATSKTLTELEEIKPVDFWTRMTHVAEIKHPLDYEETEKTPPKSKVLECFFKFFWWERIEKYYKVDLMAPQPKTEHPEKLLMYWQIYELVKEKKLENMSANFAKQLNRSSTYKNIKLHKISIRGIRSMVSRMVSIAISDILQGHDPKNKFKRELQNVIEELLEVSNLDKAKNNFHGDEYQVTEACKLISKIVSNDSVKK